MQIQGYGNVQGLDSIYADEQRRRRKTESTATQLGDTATFSAEAMELLAKMRAEKAAASAASEGKPGNGSDQKSDSDTSDQGLGTGGVAKADGGGGESSGDSDISEEIAKLEERIKTLSGQVQGIMSGPGDPQTKMDKAEPFENQINDLRQRISELQQQAREQAKNKG